jgi:ABC-type siderophore export system fused ATPase/permease subunit
MLEAAEREQLLRGFNATQARYPQVCLQELFEAQVRAQPDAVAVLSGVEQLSYAQLNARANQVAHWLRCSGVKPDARVVEIKDGCFSTVQLSQGQRKRLALVSALARDKNIYVLDEWAADQDPHYRRVFYREIIPWMHQKGKTVIAVTHDDRYFDAADRRFELEMGTVRREERALAETRHEHAAAG